MTSLSLQSTVLSLLKLVRVPGWAASPSGLLCISGPHLEYIPVTALGLRITLHLPTSPYISQFFFCLTSALNERTHPILLFTHSRRRRYALCQNTQTAWQSIACGTDRAGKIRKGGCKEVNRHINFCRTILPIHGSKFHSSLQNIDSCVASLSE